MTTLALIGVGKWGKNIVSTLETLPDARLAYLCARTEKTLASYSEKYEKLVDWRKLLKKKDLDAVLIATPPSTHRELIEAALKAGKHVFVEKPMALSLGEAEQIKKLVISSGKILMIGYQYLFNNYVRYLKQVLEQGSLGKILELKSEHRVSPSRPDTDIFWDAGPHPLSVFQYFFNPKKIISAEGAIRHDDAHVTVTFKDSPTLEISASCGGKIKTRKLTVRGEKGTAVLDETLENNKLAISINGGTSRPDINSSQPLKNEMEHFLRCIQTGSVPLTDVDFGCRTTEWLEAVSKKFSK